MEVAQISISRNYRSAQFLKEPFYRSAQFWPSLIPTATNPNTKFREHFRKLLADYPVVKLGYMGFPKDWDKPSERLGSNQQTFPSG